MAKKGVEGKAKDFSLRDVVKRFGERNQAHELSVMGYDLSHYLFDLLKNSDSGGDLTVRELSEIAYDAANELGEKYIIIKKEY